MAPVFFKCDETCFKSFHFFSTNLDRHIFQLLYFAADPDPFEGFLRGLSVVSNQPMPSSKSLVHLPQPMTDEYGGDVSVPQIQVHSVA